MSWKRVEQELDILQLVKTQMKAKILMRELLSPIERYLLINNRRFLANEEVSNSDSNNGSEHKDMQRQYKEQSTQDPD